jgi:hypothetical protein
MYGPKNFSFSVGPSQYYGGGGDLMGLIAVALLAIVAMPLVGGYVLVTGKDEGSKLLDGALLVGGLIVWAALGLR